MIAFYNHDTAPRRGKRTMNKRTPSCLLAVAFLAGCGGSGSNPSTTPAIPEASLAAVGPISRFGTTPSGFDDSGSPIFAVANGSGSKWTVSASEGEPLYEIPVAGVLTSTPEAVSGRYVVGSYEAAGSEYGLIVAANSSGTLSQKRYPGYSLYASDGGKALVFDNTSDTGSPAASLLDMAAGTFKAVPLPEGSVPYAIKGGYALCSTGRGRAATKTRSRATGGMLLFNLDSGALVPLKAPPGTDGSVYAYVLNSKGQVLGVTYAGAETQMRIWSPSGEPGEVIDSVTNAGTGEGTYLEPGWLSEDVGKMTYSKYVGDSAESFMRIGATSYDLTTAAFPLQGLRDLNPSATAGFGFDPVLGKDVAVSISYR